MTRKQIDEHTIGVLEFEAVRNILGTFAASDLGRDAAGRLYPSTDPRWTKIRIGETSEMRAILDGGERVPMAGLRDIRPLLKEFGKKETVFEPQQLLEIADTLAASGRLRLFLTNLPVENRHLEAMGNQLGDFDDIVNEINRCIGADKRVRDDASERMREIRRQIEQLSEKIHSRFMEIVSSPSLRRAIENDKFLMRHGRPVVALKSNLRNALHGTVLDRSNTGATLYVEPDALVELSNDLEDAVFEEKKEVGRILWQLTRAVLDAQDRIVESVRILALVDLTYAKARFSIAYVMSAPEICAEAVLNLRQARHPLLLEWAAKKNERAVAELTNEIVPIDVRLGDDFDLLLVTGPNTGGKTVVLKTIGLLTLMAQSGMHIPARPGSKLSVFRQVFADIGDEQSIQQSLSTFSAHLRQIVNILDNTGDGTLVLLDELGAGTDPTEGAVLATAVLDDLLHKGGKIVATTHLGQLKSYAYSAPRSQNASVQFDIKTLEPTYKLMIGTPGSSNALVIAEHMGMHKDVLKKAQSMLETQSDGTSQLINQIQAIREDSESKRTQAQSSLDEAQQIRTRLRERLARVRDHEQLLHQQVDREIDDTMKTVREAVDSFMADMKNAPQTWNQKAEGLAKRVNELAASTALAQRHAQFIEGLRRGDCVYVIPFRREGIVERLRQKREKVVVLVDSKEVEVSFLEISRPRHS
jgi:DNA mismatch repair protein MutS2